MDTACGGHFSVEISKGQYVQLSPWSAAECMIRSRYLVIHSETTLRGVPFTKARIFAATSLITR